METNNRIAFQFTLKVWISTVFTSTILTLLSLFTWELMVRHKPITLDPLFMETAIAFFMIALIFSLLPAILLSLVVAQIINRIQDQVRRKWVILIASMFFIGLSYVFFLLYGGVGREISIKDVIAYVGDFLLTSGCSVIACIVASICYFKIGTTVPARKNLINT